MIFVYSTRENIEGRVNFTPLARDRVNVDFENINNNSIIQLQLKNIVAGNVNEIDSIFNSCPKILTLF